MTSGAQPAGAPQQQKKGLPVLAWVGIGCGVILLLVVVVLVAGGMFMAHKIKQAGLDPELWEKQPALAASKLVTAFNPDLEVVEVDEDGGTITIRNKETGEVVTLDLDDVKRGEISFKDETTGKEVRIQTSGGDEEGTVTVTDESGTEVMTLGEGASVDLPPWVPVYPGTTATGRFASSSGGTTTVSVGLETTDPVEKVVEFYKARLREEGFETSVTTFAGDDGKGGIVTGRDESADRSIQVMIGAEDGTTSISLTATGKE